MTEQEYVDMVYENAIKLMHQEKKSDQQVRTALQNEYGLDEAAANIVISNSHNMISEAKRSAGRKDMLYGALWCIGGILVTIISYSIASNGGTYVVAWGAVVFGAIQFFRGLFNAF